MMKALITGITGFTGSHLAEHLIGKNADVTGTFRGRWRHNILPADIKDKVQLLECDLSDPNSVFHTIEEAQADVIYHLAAQTFVPTSWRAPQETMYSNVIGTLNILEAVRKCGTDPVILITGSSEEYGLVYPEETPIKETNPLRPLSPYAVSKVAQDLMGFQYHKSYGMKIIRTRSFNIVGPRSGDKIVAASFAKQVAQIEKGAEPVIYTGNLDAIRDFNDVRDIARAYEVAVHRCKAGEVYNISSQKGWTIRQVLEALLSMTDAKINVRQDEKRMRPSDVPILIGDSAKFRQETGWKPLVSFEQSMKDVLDYWRSQI